MPHLYSTAWGKWRITLRGVALTNHRVILQHADFVLFDKHKEVVLVLALGAEKLNARHAAKDGQIHDQLRVVAGDRGG
eukprot:360995-Chlamydomonas_euryale.AAC.1